MNVFLYPSIMHLINNTNAFYTAIIKNKGEPPQIEGEENNESTAEITIPRAVKFQYI